MKFLSILKDSLRESIDAKVFYVMMALSLLLIGVGATTTFSPKPGGKMVMTLAALPLSLDLNNLDPAEVQGKNDPTGIFSRLRGNFEVKEVYPLNNAEDLPGSTFRVIIEPSSLLPFLMARPKPQTVIPQIRERFGVWDDRRIAEVLEVTEDRGRYAVDARLTPIGLRLWPHDFSLFFGALPINREGAPLGAQLYALENIIVNTIGAWVTLLVSVVITAFFIPNMLRKGTIDMLLVKPMHRVTLLLYKYVGGLLFIFLNTTLAVGGVWLALSLRSGIWSPGFLVAIPVITFFFAILYSVSTLFGVLTRSPIVSILMTCGVWFFLFVVGLIQMGFEVYGKVETMQVRRNAGMIAATAVAMPAAGDLSALVATVNVLHVETNRLVPYEKTEGRFARIVRGVHFVLPRTSDLDALMTTTLQRDLLVMPRGLGLQALLDRQISWWESLTVSGVFIVVVLGLSCWWFVRRDY